MLTVFIVDDEKNICALIKSLIDWDRLYLEYIGEAYDGVTALEAIKENSPDIVITDIKMPEFDGLELIKRSKDLGGSISFILISGHREFKYAHAAIQYGVANYLLKPLEKQSLEQALIQIIEKKTNHQSGADKDGAQFDPANSARLKKTFIQHLLFLPATLKDMTPGQLDSIYAMGFQPGLFRFLALKPDGKAQYDTSQIKNMLSQINGQFDSLLDDLSDIADFASYQNPDSIIYIVNYTDEALFHSQLTTAFDALRIRFFAFCHITIGLSTPKSDVGSLDAKEAYKAAYYRLAMQNDKIIQYDRYIFRSIRKEAEKELGRLRDYIDILSIEKINNWFTSIETLSASRDADPSEVYELIVGAGDIWLNKLDQLSVEDADSLREKVHLADYLSATKAGLVQAMNRAITDGIEAYMAEVQKKDTAYVRLAKEYISEHYAENISLEDIAGKTFINPSYFSTLFKKEEGENFSDYLLRYRMNKAKELLKRYDLSIADVAVRTGYQDYRYFSKVFYKVFGVKPSEYRKLY